MAEPREFTEPVPQIQVRRLEGTGWSAPAGWYGFVAAAGSGIVRRAGGMSAEDGLTALERLGSPEQESRSQEHEGRRLIRVNGGYLVLNYDKYRERDYTAADRVRRWRERHGVTRNSNAVTRNVTVTEAESRSREQKQKEPKSKPARAKRADTSPTAVAAEVVAFEPDTKQREWAAVKAPSVPVDLATEDWKIRLDECGYRTKQGPIVSALASWRRHMRNAEEWGAYTKKNGNGHGRRNDAPPSAREPAADPSKPRPDYGHKSGIEFLRELEEKKRLLKVSEETP